MINPPTSNPLRDPATISLLILTALYAGGGYICALMLGQGDDFRVLHYFGLVGLASALLAFLFIIGRIIWVMAVIRPARLAAFIIDDFKNWVATPGRATYALPVIIAFMVFISVFTSLKMMIPVFAPFWMDGIFVRADQLIHFGIDPWRITHAVFAHPYATTLINFIYNCWFFVMFGVLFTQLFNCSDRARRMQFFHAFFLTWMVNGTVLAFALSSAGPWFETEGTEIFAPLFSLLENQNETSPVWALSTQNMLLESYQRSGIGVGTGISAMPSVHVATAFLFVMLAWKRGAVLRGLSFVFLAAIMIGSVHLGWHYAVDGYVAIPVTALIWLLSGRWVAYISAPKEYI